MSADPILYCLQHLTDYRQFERLASDLMAGSGYPDIEPIGGTGDGGRDALHRCRSSGTMTIFAYSVRVDWETKLRQDCKRIDELADTPDRVVFVSTQTINATQKDAMRIEIDQQYGWPIDYFDIERIRVMLVGPQSSLVGQHPAIFCSPWFERRGGVLVSQEQHNLIVIDHVASDHALATWQFRKLMAAGYDAWCFGVAPLAGENADESIRTLIRQRAARYLPLLSPLALDNLDFRARWAVSLSQPGQTLPCAADSYSDKCLDSQMARLVPIRFQESWLLGLQNLLEHLHVAGIPGSINPVVGQRIALDAYMPEPLLRSVPESVYANVFKAHVPKMLLLHELVESSSELPADLDNRWAFARRGNLLFSFAPPPANVSLRQSNPSAYRWKTVSERFGVISENMVKELLRKSLHVACYRAGFRWCEVRKTLYLQETTQQRHGYQHVDGSYTYVTFTGQRTWGYGDNKAKFRYQLGPQFRVGFDEDRVIWVTVRFYVRITDTTGVPLERTKIPSRRKRVTSNWWNREWLQRTLGVMQFIAGDGADNSSKIIVGKCENCITVDVFPMTWRCPVSIDVEALDRTGDFQEELSVIRSLDDVEDADD